MLVIPAYRETSGFLRALTPLADTLLILVLNQPDSEPDATCNDFLREYVQALPGVADLQRAHAQLFELGPRSQLLQVERPNPLPRREGVGLARKLGCDMALALHALGRVDSPWIYSSDADAVLPAGYFDAAAECSDATALTYSYRHRRPENPRKQTAMALYERRMHLYVDGLRSAGSPYAFHTLGSCLAMKATAYAQVRGVPRRAGGEDFYLLNKLAKLGEIATPACEPIVLSARVSDRVPFGTGPALADLLKHERPEDAEIFYHPHCFECLRQLLDYAQHEGEPGLTAQDFAEALIAEPQIAPALGRLGLAAFLGHAMQQCADKSGFRRQFHQWFDGFRTLKFVHAMSEHWPRLNASALDAVGGSSKQ